MRSRWLIIAGGLGALGVVLGAFGAHGLKGRLTVEMLAVFETGVRYHMYHAIAIFAVALIGTVRSTPNVWPARACTAWLLGIVLFSGSLYVLAITGVRWLGAITPIGGVAFIVGWLLVLVAGLRGRSAGD